MGRFRNVFHEKLARTSFDNKKQTKNPPLLSFLADFREGEPGGERNPPAESEQRLPRHGAHQEQDRHGTVRVLSEANEGQHQQQRR